MKIASKKVCSSKLFFSLEFDIVIIKVDFPSQNNASKFESVFPALYGQALWSYNWDEATIANIALIITVICLVSFVLVRSIVVQLYIKKTKKDN